MFKQLIKGLKTELEQQSNAFDEHMLLFKAKEKEFEDLKSCVQNQL